MIHTEGENYHFFICTPDSVARVDSKISPFYDFPPRDIEELPYLYSQPSLIPKFLYNIRYDRREYPSGPMRNPSYLSLQGKKVISEEARFPQGSYEIFDGREYPILSNPYSCHGNVPVWIRREDRFTQLGAMRNETFFLSRQNRKRMQSTRYLSLRDIVNPELDEEMVIRKIEDLYFDAESKTFLFRLVKILYAGTPSEEQQLVSNLFSHEAEFAKFLRDRIFSIEILPLIHGPFLNTILNKIDERILRFSVPKLSVPVRRMVERNVSKNRWKQILASPIKKPEPGESFEEIVEKEIFRRFSRRIYYEEGNFVVYKEEEDSEKLKLGSRSKSEFTTLPSEKYNLHSTGREISLYSVTKEKLLFLTKEFLEIIRFDLLLSRKEKDSFEYFKIPKDTILEIPRYDQTKLVVGAAIPSDRKPLEFSLASFNY
ncbi:hypothetical protein EHQ61_04420 [Leptospira wolffii]|uniref:hypothetical protein n=1 Tax=Leptospira wolffii TaxID=409998 RepID=UPI001084149C|nr:hypothetical protein [Leptospira wolffii]TGL53895.1 hypothetical protein EHQ61_04420 [Leptospira wolffii]